MVTLSSTSRSETISTVRWSNGIYVVKATIGDGVFPPSYYSISYLCSVDSFNTVRSATNISYKR